VRCPYRLGGYNSLMSASSASDSQGRRDDIVVNLLRTALPGLIAAYRFGSSAAGASRPDSDLDFAFLGDRRLDPVVRFALQEQVASALRTDVDLVDLRSASTVMASQVVTTGILLRRRRDGATRVRGFRLRALRPPQRRAPRHPRTHRAGGHGVRWMTCS
jgi:predicted nucleotidyltransferase